MSEKLTTNANLLSPLGWKMNLSRRDLVNLEYTVVAFSMPGISMAPTEVALPGATMYVPSEKLTWGDLTVRVVANENLENYMEVYDWLLANKVTNTPVDASIVLSLLTSHKNLNKKFVFSSVFPTSLGGFELTTSADSVEYIQFDVGFRYDTFELV